MSKQFRFTKRAIDALPPHDPKSASTDTEYSDTDTKGLRCCVNKKGQKSFLLRYSFNGNKRATKLGDYGPLDVEAARKKAMEIHRKVSDGIDPRATPAASPAMPSFLDFWTKDYVPDAKNRKRSFNKNPPRFSKPASVGPSTTPRHHLPLLQWPFPSPTALCDP